MIVLAGPARPLEEAIVAQSRYLAAADGTTSTEEQRVIDDAETLATTVRGLKPEDAKTGRMIAGAPFWYGSISAATSPTAAAAKVKAPMLILQGGRDYQVTPEEFEKWKAALGARRDVTFHNYPQLNHLFIAGAGPSLPAEYGGPGAHRRGGRPRHRELDSGGAPVGGSRGPAPASSSEPISRWPFSTRSPAKPLRSTSLVGRQDFQLHDLSRRGLHEHALDQVGDAKPARSRRVGGLANRAAA